MHKNKIKKKKQKRQKTQLHKTASRIETENYSSEPGDPVSLYL